MSHREAACISGGRTWPQGPNVAGIAAIALCPPPHILRCFTICEQTDKRNHMLHGWSGTTQRTEAIPVHTMPNLIAHLGHSVLGKLCIAYCIHV